MSDNGVSLNRRAVLLAAGAAAATAAVPKVLAAASSTKKSFPKGFRWGVATAAHQIEGNNVNSDLWFMENIQPTTFKERSGDTCDSYHRYEEDIAIIAGLGLNTYRFSIEWARIEPSRGHFSAAELDYYKRVIECCQKHNVSPAVTFYHVSAPRWFAEAGGWLNPESPALFSNYCSRAARALGDGMAHAFTINEPQVGKTYRAFAQSSPFFAEGDKAERAAHAAAAKATASDRFVTMNYPEIDAMTPQLIAAHEQGFAAIKAARSQLPVGVTLNVVDFQPATTRNKFRELRQVAYGAWLEAARKTGDFVGVQTYRQIRIPGEGDKLPAPPSMPFAKPDDLPEQIKQPLALANAVTYIHDEVKKPIFVTENGIETQNDERRVWYIPQVLAGLHDAMNAGVPVIGYCHWSLLDNFEWLRGYEPHFGIVAVDRLTFKRTVKPSGKLLGEIAKRNAI
jgi:beta-glucosidase